MKHTRDRPYVQNTVTERICSKGI